MVFDEDGEVESVGNIEKLKRTCEPQTRYLGPSFIKKVVATSRRRESWQLADADGH